MRCLILFSVLLSGCSALLPDAMTTIEDLATDNAITIKVQKEALQKETDVDISVSIRNTALTKQP